MCGDWAACAIDYYYTIIMVAFRILFGGGGGWRLYAGITSQLYTSKVYIDHNLGGLGCSPRKFCWFWTSWNQFWHICRPEKFKRLVVSDNLIAPCHVPALQFQTSKHCKGKSHSFLKPIACLFLWHSCWTNQLSSLMQWTWMVN